MKDKRLIMKKCCEERFALVKSSIQELLNKNEKETIFVAIDGKCASGKTTLGYYLKEIFDCNLFHMDDFFLQDYQRTKKRLAEVGGNVDYERFKREVLMPVIKKEDVKYRVFNCMKNNMDDMIMIPYKQLNIVEGSYSMHPYFDDIYDLCVFMNIDDDNQIENIRKRNGEKMLIRFKEEWIPKENAYFNKFDIKDKCIHLQWKK